MQGRYILPNATVMQGRYILRTANAGSLHSPYRQCRVVTFSVPLMLSQRLKNGKPVGDPLFSQKLSSFPVLM